MYNYFLCHHLNKIIIYLKLYITYLYIKVDGMQKHNMIHSVLQLYMYYYNAVFYNLDHHAY